MNNKLSLSDILALDSLEAAPQLLGVLISRHLPQGLLSLRIVETEAYHQNDPASHSFRGITARTAPMFETGGTIYVYFTYGMHYCLNIVTGQKGAGEAVLIRAAEPLAGLEIMRKNRNTNDIYKLANGPAKLTQALGIKDTKLSGKKLNKSSIFLSAPENPIIAVDVVVARRIGISEAAQQPWRFYIKDNPFVSKLL